MTPATVYQWFAVSPLVSTERCQPVVDSFAWAAPKIISTIGLIDLSVCSSLSSLERIGSKRRATKDHLKSHNMILALCSTGGGGSIKQRRVPQPANSPCLEQQRCCVSSAQRMLYSAPRARRINPMAVAYLTGLTSLKCYA
jgi:hypothetical protein